MSAKVYQYGLQALSEAVAEGGFNTNYCKVWNAPEITSAADSERGYYTSGKDNPMPLENRKGKISGRKATTEYLRAGSKESGQRVRYLSYD